MLRMIEKLATGWHFTCLLTTAVTAAAAPAPFFSCTDYHCDEGKSVTLDAQQWQAVRRLFDNVSSAREERLQIRQAIALLETEVGAITGTWQDQGGNVQGAGKPGQLDCISESRNTTTYLQLLQDDHLFHWHQVEPRTVRYLLVFAHWSAVIRERDSGERYAVDSWFLDNGQLPYIQTLRDWQSRRPFNSGQEDLGDQQRLVAQPEY
jgi:hypothetical protein